MTDPLPDLDIYTAATDPPAQQRYNELLIEQFRTTAGKVTGQFAKTGAPRTTPLGVVPQSGCQPNGVGGTAQRILRRAGQGRER